MGGLLDQQPAAKIDEARLARSQLVQAYLDKGPADDLQRCGVPVGGHAAVLQPRAEKQLIGMCLLTVVKNGLTRNEYRLCDCSLSHLSTPSLRTRAQAGHLEVLLF